MFDTTELYPPGTWFTPEQTVAWIVAFTVVLVALLGFFVWSRRRHLRRAARAAEAQDIATGALCLGETVVAGTVVDDGEEPPVVVVIEQMGKEWRSKNGWRHKWQEVRRTVHVRPFYIERPNGGRVRVEPDRGIFLIDALGTPKLVPNEPRRRHISAQLCAGEHVFVTGTLEHGGAQQGGYREAPVGMVLRPPPRGRMVISTETLAERHLARARVHRNLAIGALLTLMVMNLGIFVDTNALLLFGRTVPATVTGRFGWKEWEPMKNSNSYSERQYWTLYFRCADARGCSHSITSSAFTSAALDSLRPGTRVPLLVAGPFVHLGTRAVVDGGRILFAVLLLAPFVAICIYGLVRTRPWYDRAFVDNSQNGRLPTSQT
jgi:hypothetical protein